MIEEKPNPTEPISLKRNGRVEYGPRKNSSTFGVDSIEVVDLRFKSLTLREFEITKIVTI